MQQHNRCLTVLDLKVLVDQALALVDRPGRAVVQMLHIEVQRPDLVAVQTEARPDLDEKSIRFVLKNCGRFAMVLVV